MRCLLEGSLAALGRLKRRALPQAVVGPPASHSNHSVRNFTSTSDGRHVVVYIAYNALFFRAEREGDPSGQRSHVDEVMPLHQSAYMRTLAKA